MYWKTDGEKCYPQWNLFEDDQAKNLREVYKQKQKEVKEEKKLLEKHLKALMQLDSVEDLIAYKEKNSLYFTNDQFQIRWEEEFENLLNRIKHKEKYFASRMKEFGIHEARMNKKQKTIWLKEMLKIEEEVKPYIKYVRKAFQTALPIRRNVIFSNERHVNDGVEFDPNTIFDQEKWIRADVMKVMESKVERGEAVQINTFCLDYSGSMKHDRMRNLFKILYLLVLGLEDRKSYDSFHFFSNNFIEVVNFSEAYTNRKVLFSIMQQIATLIVGEVHFFGEGGTNISDGVIKSHRKMSKFVKEFKTKNPDANIVCSIFVITDGEPSLGVIDIPDLNAIIQELREDGDVEIKGIFINSEDDVSMDLMSDIFGEDNYIETTDFEEGVNKFVKIMTETYKKQRKAYKWKLKKQKLGLKE